MLNLPSSVKIFVATGPVDLRKGFDSLAVLTRRVLREDPHSGHLFVFINRRCDRAKILVWDHSGFWLLFKRLERGRFPEVTTHALWRMGDQQAVIHTKKHCRQIW